MQKLELLKLQLMHMQLKVVLIVPRQNGLKMQTEIWLEILNYRFLLV